MKTFFCLTFLAVAAHATIVYVDSNAFTTTNSSGSPTVDLRGVLHGVAPLPGSDWISYRATGDNDDEGYSSPQDGKLVTFTTQFLLIGSITGGGLDVLADDSTSVILNGHTLIAADTTPGKKCSDHPLGCRTSTEGIFTFAQLSPYLVDGTNTLSFGVVQVARSSFGLDFAGSVNDGTPEPATVAFMGLGLAALTALRRRREAPMRHLVI